MFCCIKVYDNKVQCTVYTILSSPRQYSKCFAVLKCMITRYSVPCTLYYLVHVNIVNVLLY